MIRDLLAAAAGYVRNNPESIVRTALDVRKLRFGVPLAALGWLATQVKGKKAPRDIEVGSVPPALRLGATLEAMGTLLRARGSVRVEDIEISPDSIRIGVRLSEIDLEVLDDSETPLATLVRSGALDLSKVGNLAKFVPKRPAAIVEAHDDRIVVDLMKIPGIADNAVLRRVLNVVTPVLGIRAIETDRDHLYVHLRTRPAGLREAIDALRAG